MITRICDRCGSTIKEDTYSSLRYLAGTPIMEAPTFNVCINLDLCVLCFIKLKDFVIARELTNA